MKSWLGLVVAPSVALATQSFMYSMVTPACSTQTRVQLHLAAAVALAIVLVLAVFAFSESSVRRGEPTSHDSDISDRGVGRRFLATMATAVAALSGLVIVGMWFALWVLTPCEP
jgi:high-affinity nickel permease